jgi:hypothetical protein
MVMNGVEEISAVLIGRTPLLMHNGVLADPLDERNIALASVTGKRVKTLADHREIARLEWFGGLWLHEGRPCIPGKAIKAVMVDAAKTRNRGKSAKRALWVEQPAMLQYDGPADIRELWKDENFRHRSGVRVHGSTTQRTRARFPDWKTRISIQFLTATMNRSELEEYLHIGGYLIGIGDGRPEHGKFVVQIE